jgi:hypothetical protein
LRVSQDLAVLHPSQAQRCNVLTHLVDSFEKRALELGCHKEVSLCSIAHIVFTHPSTKRHCSLDLRVIDYCSSWWQTCSYPHDPGFLGMQNTEVTVPWRHPLAFQKKTWETRLFLKAQDP